MSLRSGTKKYGTQVDEFVKIDGYSRNLVLEEKLQREVDQVMNEVSPSSMKAKFPHTRGEFLPTAQYSLPSWWGSLNLGDFYDESNYGWGFTHQTALEYMKLSKKFHEAQINLWQYQCRNYPRDPVFCQHAAQNSGRLSRINKLIPMIEARITSSFDFIPQVFAEEEDPSVNSGLNGNEQESQVVNYPQSANVRIVVSNIGMFSTSIPINDISQLQILSNESNEWRYTLIGTSTNQPLMTLSGLINKINSMIASVVTPQPPVTQPPVIEPPVVTTVHVPPPDIVLDPSDGLPEVPVTVTPTEPGQINWIPEPFFSFINNVFRR